MSPLIYLSVILGLMVPVTYVVTKAKALQAAQAAYRSGVEVGQGQAASSNAASVEATVKALREEVDKTSLPKDKAEIIALCKRSPSCRERGSLK